MIFEDSMLRMRKSPEKNAPMPLKKKPKHQNWDISSAPKTRDPSGSFIQSQAPKKVPLQATHRLSWWIVPQGDSQKLKNKPHV